MEHSGMERAGVLQALLDERHSCRDFLPQTVPRETIARMLRMAQRTASWCNTQPWRLFLGSGDSTRRLKEALAQVAGRAPAEPDMPFPAAYENEHLARRRAAGFQLYAAAGIEKGDRQASRALSLKNFELFGAPHCLVVATPAYLGPYALVDCGGWIANFLLAAQAHGVAAIPQAALAQHAPVLRRHFDIDPALTIICGISLGFERQSSPLNAYRTDRAPMEEVCAWHA
ncbi:nitroreductase [Bordetella genomosp. 6]|uniref:Nitroreductase n=2 Tax=Bordetella genomosp. 6 TaxID=463024 RepID=A0ABX4FG50_9BORD|nr:nitroreductase [Bordetella genomosp. 6]